MGAEGAVKILYKREIDKDPASESKLIADYRGRIYPGDVFIGNDPYEAAGQHLPDIYIAMPIFDQLAAISFGRSPLPLGSFPPELTLRPPSSATPEAKRRSPSGPPREPVARSPACGLCHC